MKILAPGVGFEPTRAEWPTGSQGLRIVHSATPAFLDKYLMFSYVEV